jgi:hypothetical protein
VMLMNLSHWFAELVTWNDYVSTIIVLFFDNV